MSVTAFMQPVAAGDVATVLVDLMIAPPVNGMGEVTGPEPFPPPRLRVNTWPQTAVTACWFDPLSGRTQPRIDDTTHSPAPAAAYI
ncbi:hypothetical protein [Nitrosospira sp. Nsp14]|uniref:hypothetical protein n=1 Tax=Nitrosospira sp. Nsp14 TaxID=1855333 RepID=UPI000B811A6D|nr:hypothetical protein [Nitrosospira sp. Nsp14]